MNSFPINFPPWGDLGMGSMSQQTVWTWENQLYQAEHYRYYFDGGVFNERIQLENANAPEDQPLLQPVGLNLVKMLCLAQSDAIFGEWDDLPLTFGVRQDEAVSNADQDAAEWANTILRTSNAGQMFWEHELDRNVYGGGAIKISPALASPGRVKWAHIPQGCFFPIWDPDNADELLEVYCVTAMSQEQAKAKFGYDGDKMIIRRVEHWTKSLYTNTLDNFELRDYSGYNPWGVIPFVYTPRVRFSNWYGDSLVEDIIPVQNELNMRVADIGEAVNYNSHPVRWGLNLPRAFNTDNFPLDPNALWDLGRSLGNNPPPQVGLLEAAQAVSPGVLDHIKFLYDWSRTSVFSPPIAFGEDNGGGQRSGATLEIRMWPLIKSVRRSRSYLTTSLNQALKISALIMQQKNLDIPKRAIQSVLDGRLVPQYRSIMPRDQQAVVDEVVKLLSTQPPSISLETAQVILGRGVGEVERITTMMDDEELFPPPPTTPQEKPVDKTSVPNG